MVTAKKALPSLSEVFKLIIGSLNDDKAENVISIFLGEKSTVSDYLIIATGLSRRHVNAMADHLHRILKGKGIKKISVEGANQCDWILIDIGDIIIHIFRKEIREFYNLEKIWTGLDKDGDPVNQHAP